MIEVINDTIHEAIAKVEDTIVEAKRVKNYELEEPDYTAALAIEFPRLINGKKVFPNITFGGCFIHQSPMVTFHSPHNAKRCELGDLLVLIRKRTMDDIRYNAALVQLKKSNKNPIVLKDDGDLKQLYLYEKWPLFTMSSTHLQYDVFPKAVIQGALYCIIKRNPDMLYMADPMSMMEFSGEMTLGRFIRDVIHWQTGRAISDETHKDSDEWSRLIWDLIQNVKNKVIHKGVFNRTNIGYDGHNKLSDDFLDFMLSLDEGIPTNEDMILDDDESGISILFIDIDDTEREGEQRR